MTVDPDDDLRERIEQARLHSIRAACARLVEAYLPADTPSAQRDAEALRVFENLRRRVRAGDPTIPKPVIPAGVSGLQWTERQVQSMIQGDNGFTLEPKRGAGSATYRHRSKREGAE